jgi:transposase
MNVLDFEKLVKSEKTAMHYVLTRCSMAGGFRCPACPSEKLYEIENGRRRRCARCGRTFNPLAGRYLNNVKLPAREWLWLIKLFELEMSATVIAGETGISYPTVLKAVDTIRCALAEARSDSRSVPESCEATRQLALVSAPGARGAEPNGSDGVVVHLAFGDDCIILTKRSSDGVLLTCGRRKLEVVDHGKSFPRLKVYCSAKGFWPFAKERLVKYHGVPLAKLPCYLDEMSFRWMNRGTPLFDLILEKLCHYAPETGSPSEEKTPAPELVPEECSIHAN